MSLLLVDAVDMDSLSATMLILSGLEGYGMAIFLTLGVLLGTIGVGVLIYEFGWKTLMNLPGGIGYDSSKGSGLSRWSPRKNVRSASGSINLLD